MHSFELCNRFYQLGASDVRGHRLTSTITEEEAQWHAYFI